MSNKETITLNPKVFTLWAHGSGLFARDLEGATQVAIESGAYRVSRVRGMYGCMCLGSGDSGCIELRG